MIDSIKAYNGEYIKRGVLWYIIVFSIIIFLIIFSFLKWWIMWAISVLFIFLIIIVSYIILYLMSLKKIEIQLYDWYFIIWDKTYSFDELQWFNADLSSKWEILNFILIPKKTLYPLKYKLRDSQDKAKNFISNVIKLWLPIYSDYENVKMYKIIKYLKLW